MKSLQTAKVKYRDTELSFYFFNFDFSDEKCFSRHKHTYYEIHFITEGKHTYRVGNGRDIPVSKGQMIIIPPGVLHNGIIEDDPSFHYAVLSMDISEGSIGNRMELLLEEQALVAVPCAQELTRAAEELFKMGIQNDVKGLLLQKKLASEVAYYLFSGIKDGELKSEVAVDDKEMRVLLENCIICPDLTTEGIADIIGYSKRHTERLIRKIYGKTLSEIRGDFGKQLSSKEN